MQMAETSDFQGIEGKLTGQQFSSPAARETSPLFFPLCFAQNCFEGSSVCWRDKRVSRTDHLLKRHLKDLTKRYLL